MRLTIKMRKPRGNPFEMLGQNKKSSINANPSLFGRLYEMPRLISIHAWFMATYVLLKCHSLRNVGTPNKIQHQFLIKTSCPLHRKPSHKEKKSILGDEVSGPDDFLNCALSQNKTQLPLCVSVPTAMLFSTCCSNTPKFQRQKLKAENQKKSAQ